MTQVTELGYMGLTVSDLPAWRAFAGDPAGLQRLDEDEGDRAWLRMDAWHHRCVLHRGAQDNLTWVGWRVPEAGRSGTHGR